MDQSRRMLTFFGKNDTAIAAHNCEIVRLNNNNTETPIPFGEILPDDSLEIKGVRQQNQYILADKIRNCTKMGNFDVAFRDTILTIDYEAGTLTVSGRPEIILTDSSTFVGGSVTHSYAYDNQVGGSQPQFANAGKQTYQYTYSYSRDTSLTFDDLVVGNVVEVRANIVDSATLLAVYIKVANCQEKPQQCIQFTAPLESVDASAKIVTWQGYTWVGFVCKGSKLFAADGTELTLADFAVGENVAIKGLPLTGDTLKVCQMEKVAE
jgi:hypothetical protein